MRIQHNITAMNAYQNYNRNTKALAKNLEKLSSGYRINRAGDDAAGLAISEKMRAQITGLEVAQKNAKDGISLVQTAEGGMEEVHDMLNRMYSLAEQSRNGTYQDAVDREQMQKEITSLKEEINRISESVNFNGIKLLDGSLNGGAVSVSDNLTVTNDGTAPAALAAGAGRAAGTAIAKSEAFNPVTGGTDGTKYTYTVNWTKDDGTTATAKAEFEWAGSANMLMGSAGTSSASATPLSGLGGNATAAQMAQMVKACLDKDTAFAAEMDVTANADGTLSFAAKVAAANAKVTALAPSTGLGGGAPAAAGPGNTGGTNNNATPNTESGTQTVDLSKLEVMDGTALDEDKIAKNTFEIGGKKFLLVNGDIPAADTSKIASDVSIIKMTNDAAGAYAGGDTEAVAAELSRVTGLKFSGNDGDKTITNTYNSAAERLAETETDAAGNVIGTNQGLSLQIGDTAEKFNQMTVKIMSVHTKALGIAAIDVGTQAGAADAMKAIKDAINLVSGGRGDLGALQNRLDHTINNLATMHENIQDAEATIRDVDVAEEMMAYTKNNILVQSAQAMLAQANQLPQGVLQLLQ